MAKATFFEKVTADVKGIDHPNSFTISVVEKLLEKKFNELGGESFFGKLLKNDKSCRYYENGCICYNKGHAYEIHGDIYKKWQQLGGIKWGIPDTDEIGTPDGVGRFNHFNGFTASIYWTPNTGAQSINGGIREKWESLGWERSYLGYPTSDETDFPDGGRVNAFEHGGIYWWPDTGAFDVDDIVVHYTGLACRRETGETSGADEPYAIISVLTPFENHTIRTKTYSSVDSNTTRPDSVEIYRGKPNGIVITSVLMENDHGDPQKIQNTITNVIQQMHNTGVIALGTIPVVGAGIAAVAGPLIQQLVPGTGKIVSDILGLGDDKIGEKVITLTGKDLILLAKNTNNSTFKNIGFKFSTEGIQGENAEYVIYFGCIPA